MMRVEEVTQSWLCAPSTWAQRPNGPRHKFATIANVLHLDRLVQETTVLVDMSDRPAECLLHSTVTLAPPGMTWWRTMRSYKTNDWRGAGIHFPIHQKASINDPPRHDDTENEPLRCSEWLKQLEKSINYHNGIEPGLEDHNLPYARNSTHPKTGTNEDSYMCMGRIIDNKLNDNPKHEPSRNEKQFIVYYGIKSHHQRIHWNQYNNYPSDRSWKTLTKEIFHIPKQS